MEPPRRWTFAPAASVPARSNAFAEPSLAPKNENAARYCLRLSRFWAVRSFFVQRSSSRFFLAKKKRRSPRINRGGRIKNTFMVSSFHRRQSAPAASAPPAKHNSPPVTAHKTCAGQPIKMSSSPASASKKPLHAQLRHLVRFIAIASLPKICPLPTVYSSYNFLCAAGIYPNRPKCSKIVSAPAFAGLPFARRSFF